MSLSKFVRFCAKKSYQSFHEKKAYETFIFNIRNNHFPVGRIYYVTSSVFLTKRENINPGIGVKFMKEDGVRAIVSITYI